MILSFAALTQQLLGSVDSGDGQQNRHDMAADVAGFGAVANWYEEQDVEWKKAEEVGRGGKFEFFSFFKHFLQFFF